MLGKAVRKTGTVLSVLLMVVHGGFCFFERAVVPRLSAQNAECWSLLRFHRTYSALQTGMTTKQVEQKMSPFFLTGNGVLYTDYMNAARRKTVYPTPPPISPKFTGNLTYFHDVAHGRHNADIVCLKFKDGVLTNKRFLLD
jgi:hypothetical protein